MSRSTRAVVSVLLLGGFAAVPAAPVPEGAQPVLFHATKVGTTWTYQDGDEEQTFVLTAAEDKGGAKLISIARVWEDGRKAPQEKLSVSGRGVVRVEFEGNRLVEPTWLLKLPARTGEKWTRDDPTGRLWVVWTTRGMEEVGVPAGAYEALAVQVEHLHPDGSTSRSTRYYARGVGLVKVAYEGLRGPRASVLKTFTPGKD